MRRLILALLTFAIASPAAADNLTITKTATVISDQLGYTITPRSLPGATVDYKVLYQNPLANSLKPVKNITTDDVLPANVVLRVSDIAIAGKGPVEFLDGAPLGSGLFTSGLTYTFTNLGSQTDSIDFYDGTAWGYIPHADADGYDAKVRAIRITTGSATFTAGTQFQIRYRVKIR